MACKQIGKDKYIDRDSDGYRVLEKKYPLPLPVEVIVDHESRDKLLEAQDQLIKAQELITELYKQIGEKDRLIAQQESSQLLLEDKTKQLEEEKEAHRVDNEKAEDRYTHEYLRACDAEERVKAMEEKLAALEQKNAETEKQLEYEKGTSEFLRQEKDKMANAGFFKRIFKKW